ncbi:hypothetical protein [Sorangium sp. So ce1024]|uniref:hypothetical protein n=1 Tax=unclassified Sorangium TaxID=2621164 RepID=UPI003F0D5A36
MASRPLLGAASLCGLALVGAAGAACKPAAEPLPAHVRISIDGAVISPAKADGRQWDGMGVVAPGALTAIGDLLRTEHPVAAAASVAGFAAQAAGAGTEPPEPFGSAELFAGGRSLGRRVLDRSGQRDTCTPGWAGPPTWRRVPLTPDVHLRGELLDRDLVSDDFIGRFAIHHDHLVEALRARAVYPVPVRDQAAGQVLFVWIEVWPDSPDPARPE